MPRCKCCKEKFKPKYFNQKFCLDLEKLDCIKAFSTSVQEKKRKTERAAMKEWLLSKADYLNLLQKVFNTWIRERDKLLPCISCGCDMKGRKGDASHYYSVGGNPNLRFNEDNAHLSCVPCNQFKHGNLIEYGFRLPDRIGLEAFNKLANDRMLIVRLSIPEIKELIIVYKKKIKELKVNKIVTI